MTTSPTTTQERVRRTGSGRRRLGLAWLALTMIVLSALAVRAGQQAPASSGTTPTPAAAQMGNLNEVMRSILFPNANVIFNVQLEDPGEVKSTADQKAGSGFSITTWGNGLYSPWEIVGYAAVALEESALLLDKPGRQCLNGKPVPVTQPDWAKFTKEISDTAKAVYAASLAKNRDTVVDLTERLNDSCASCHNVYRRGTDADRCVAPQPSVPRR